MGKFKNDNFIEDVIASNIKDHCAWCNAKIPGTTNHYMVYGNACGNCCGRAWKIYYGIRKFARNASGKMMMTKVREYTREEKKQMILDRINEVKLNNL